MATITARIDDNVKKELKNFSEEIGISIGSLINAWAKDMLRKKRVAFELYEEIEENKEMYANAKSLKIQGENSIASGRGSLII